MTDEQIIDIRKSTRSTNLDPWSESVAFARAIERAVTAERDALLRDARQELMGTHDFLQGGMTGSTVAFTISRIDKLLQSAQ